MLEQRPRIALLQRTRHPFKAFDIFDCPSQILVHPTNKSVIMSDQTQMLVLIFIGCTNCARIHPINSPKSGKKNWQRSGTCIFFHTFYHCWAHLNTPSVGPLSRMKGRRMQSQNRRRTPLPEQRGRICYCLQKYHSIHLQIDNWR